MKESEKQELRDKIAETVKQISNGKILKLIYWFTMSGYKEEKAGG